MSRMENEHQQKPGAQRFLNIHSTTGHCTNLPPPSSSDSVACGGELSLFEMMSHAREKLETMEISCREQLNHPLSSGTHRTHNGTPNDQVALMQLQIDQLKQQLVDVVQRREDSDAIFQRAMNYASAKGTANAVLHTLFDQASAGDKNQVLESWWETGVIITRDGLKHWRLDLREIRNEVGSTVLHVAVDKSMARENLKLKLVALLVDRIGFDVNVRDAFGRTPLHVAAMAGFTEVTQALLERGADASLRDHAGLTPLSEVRTLSKPPQEIVQILANAENDQARRFVAASAYVSPQKAISSGLFLRSLIPFVRLDLTASFSQQTNALLDALLQDKAKTAVAFDEAVLCHVPLLFQSATASGSSARQLTRLHSIFLNGMFHDLRFIDELRVEACGYGHSFVTSTCTTAAALAGATCEGLLLKMIQAFKLEMVSSSASERTSQSHTASAATISESSMASEPASPASVSSQSHTRSPFVYVDHTSTVASTRQAWHYAVLYKSSTHPFPGSLAVEKGTPFATCSDDVARFFPLEDRLLIGSSEYHCVSYEAATRVIQLDREYEGVSAADVKVYLAGSCSSLLPPYIGTKRIWEREPGNKYEDHMSSEQELFHDYQFLDPDSDYEVAVKLGPVPTSQDARAIAEAWKTQSRKLFDEKKCLSPLASCAHYCPQRSGHSLCVETMAIVGRDLAKERLGRPTFSKQLKPRATMQKYQDLFLGKAPWPGSPGLSTTSASASARDVTDQLALDLMASLSLDGAT